MTSPTLTTTEIENYASRFSEILARLVKENGRPVSTLVFFPKGGCFNASRLFCAFRSEIRFTATQVTGDPIGKFTKSQHGWIVFDNSSGKGVIDLTCEQFDDCDLPCPFVSETSHWHDERWQIVERKLVSRKDLTNENLAEPELDYLNEILSEMGISKQSPEHGVSSLVR